MREVHVCASNLNFPAVSTRTPASQEIVALGASQVIPTIIFLFQMALLLFFHIYFIINYYLYIIKYFNIIEVYLGNSFFYF